MKQLFLLVLLSSLLSPIDSRIENAQQNSTDEKADENITGAAHSKEINSLNYAEALPNPIHDIENAQQKSVGKKAGENITSPAHAVEINSLYFNNITKELFNAVHDNGVCVGKEEDWYCRRDCRFQFAPHTGMCLPPTKEDLCFGTKISYNYTRHSKTNFFKFGILNRFPKCWNLLSPLICASLYRPCNSSYCHSQKIYKDKPSFPCEVWQAYPKHFCSLARDACTFLSELGLWPEVLSCEEMEANEGLTPRYNLSDSNTVLPLSGSCPIRYHEAPAFPSKFQCIWPLVNSTSSMETNELFGVKPLLDACYLPCKTPLLNSNEELYSYRTRNMILAVLSFILSGFMARYIYYKKNLLVFTIPYVFAVSYFGMWTLSYFDFYFSSSQCADSNRIRRAITYVRFLELCDIQVFVSLLYFIGMAFSMIFFSVTLLKWNTSKQERMVVGRYSSLIILFIPMLFVLGVFRLVEKNVDGMSGVCYFQSELFIGLVVCYMLLELLMIILDFGFRVKRQKDTGYKKVENAMKISNVEANQALINNSTLVDSSNQLKMNKSQPIVTNEMDKSDLVNGNQLKVSTDEKKHQADTSAIKKTCRLNVILKMTSRFFSQDSFLCRYFGFTTIEFIFLTFRLILLLFYTWCIIFVVVPFELPFEYEKESVLNSIRCSLNASIYLNNTEWWTDPTNQDHLINSTDPLLRRLRFETSINAPECNLRTLNYSETWILSFIWLILPGIWTLTFTFLMCLNMAAYSRYGDVYDGKKEYIELDEVVNQIVENASLDSHQSEIGDSLCELNTFGNYAFPRDPLETSVRKHDKRSYRNMRYCQSEAPSCRSHNKPHSVANFPIIPDDNSESISAITQLNQFRPTHEQFGLIMEKYKLVVATNRSINSTLEEASKVISLIHSKKMELAEENKQLKEENKRLQAKCGEIGSNSENDDVTSVDAQSSATAVGSDDFDSDEPDSEEERLFNQRFLRNKEGNDHAGHIKPDILN
uniref:Uncharacterized protein n=1 Tax=Acrobeloides nanus TaxID=290746 RepID=A0A914EH98_9BILA